MQELTGGGAERTVINIMNYLNKEKFKIIFVLGNKDLNDYSMFIDNDINIKYLNTSRLRYSFMKLRKAIITENPDLIFTTLNPNNILVSITNMSLKNRIPLIIREANNRTQSKKATRLNRFITKYCYNYLSNKIIALSNGVKDDLVRNFYVDDKKIQVIYNPIDLDTINKLKNEEIDDLSIECDEKIIVAVGRLVEQKDYPTLIKAFKIVSEHLKAKLLILGKGPLENELKTLVHALGIDEKIIFKGFKNNPYKYMKKADLFVLTSKWEGFGHVIVEAMACGTPVISTDCNSGPKEIIGENQYGVLVKVSDYEQLAENIINLFKSDSQRTQYILKGYERVNNFKASDIILKYEQAISETIEKVKIYK